jgi:hypothetical protein
MPSLELCGLADLVHVLGVLLQQVQSHCECTDLALQQRDRKYYKISMPYRLKKNYFNM